MGHLAFSTVKHRFFFPGPPAKVGVLNYSGSSRYGEDSFYPQILKLETLELDALTYVYKRLHETLGKLIFRDLELLSLDLIQTFGRVWIRSNKLKYYWNCNLLVNNVAIQ